MTVSGGVLTLASGSSMAAAPLHPATMLKAIEWEFRARCTYGGYDHSLRVSIFAQDGNNRWTHFGPNWQSSGILNYLWKFVDGSSYFVIKATHTGDTNWHTVRGTRTGSGAWEIFYDGVSDGTATDTWMPSSNNYFFIHNDPGTYVHDVELDYIWIRGW